ncbi:MFS transporter [Ningiella sp. W23]|uniref:MFS transporter n=1 Tax=Ningiella sp. W23 TaxID=3023715 RepID=UPI0037565910
MKTNNQTLLTKARRLGLILIANKLSDSLLSAKTTLPTLLSVSGAPGWMAQLLVPIRESGALLPQALFAFLLRTYSRRDIAWQLSMFIQFVSGALLLGLGLTLEGLAAGLAILVSLVLMSLSRALSSLTTKDIQAFHIDKGDRGKLLGSASTISSVISIAIAITALLGSTSLSSNKLIILGSIALAAKLFCMYLMRPLKTSVEIDKSSEQEKKLGGFFALANKNSLMKFIAVRSLLAHTALLAPLFVLSYDGGLINLLALLIIAQGIADFLSSYIWGALSDKSALLCMRFGAAIAFIATACLLFLPLYFDNLLSSNVFILSLFFILSIGHQGVRTGRKIYGVDIAEEQDRTEFVAFSNTFVGVSLLVLGSVYALINAYAPQLSLSMMLLGLALGITGTFFLKREK